jgi:hypothetical protein
MQPRTRERLAARASSAASVACAASCQRGPCGACTVSTHSACVLSGACTPGRVIAVPCGVALPRAAAPAAAAEGGRTDPAALRAGANSTCRASRAPPLGRRSVFCARDAAPVVLRAPTAMAGARGAGLARMPHRQLKVMAAGDGRHPCWRWWAGAGQGAEQRGSKPCPGRMQGSSGVLKAGKGAARREI